jgi:PST family polysaccharide transporter
MGADFYPRLTAVSRDDRECNRLVNEQAQISLLLAGPGVIATLTFAPVVIALFYSAEFRPAVDILRWICLGMMLRVIAWPVGFVVVAKGARGIFFWTEVAATVVHVGLAWVLVRRFGVVGSGAAFFGLYLWHALLIYAIVRRFTGFQWSTANLRIGLLFIPLAGLVFLSFAVLPFGIAMTFGTLAVVASSLYSLRRLLRLVPGDRLPGFLRGLLKRFGIVD